MNGPYIPPEEVAQVYTSLYAGAIDKLLETRWFTERGLIHVHSDPLLCERYRILVSRFGITAATHFHENLVTQSLEMHIIWETMQLCRQVSTSIDSTNDVNAAQEISEGVHEAAKRVGALEALFTNQYLTISVIQPRETTPDTNAAAGRASMDAPGSLAAKPAPKKGLDDQLRSRERKFWTLLSKLLCIKDELASPLSSPTATTPALANKEQNPPVSLCPKIDATLYEMRGLLDSRENRDVLYSVAVARYMPRKALVEEKAGRGRLDPIPETVGPNDEENPRVKIEVARNFVRSEAGGRGTTQVFQRVCGMVCLMWQRSKDM